jgi:Coenzyme PQQ synthesis protein D (PqqD)
VQHTTHSLSRTTADVGSIRYHIVDGVLARPVGDMVVLFHPETERLLTLHDSGPRIWELLSEEASASRIVARLMDEFDGPGSLIEQQVLEFLEQLKQERIIRQEE